MSRRWTIYRTILALGLMALSLFMHSAAFAGCTNPTREYGAIIYNSAQNVPQVCANGTWVALGALNPSAGGGSCSNPSRTEGAIVYNVDHGVLQYCDGTNWIAVQAAPAGTCLAPTLCPNIGDVCDDGNPGTTNDPIFAGFMSYNDPNSADFGACKALYVTDANQSASSQWKTSTGTDDIATDSTEDGKINDGQIANSSTFPAFKLCKDLTDGGYTDWYLPSRAEFDLLQRNSASIPGLSGYFWSSSEYGTGSAWYQYVANDYIDDDPKTNNRDVRCVRRD